MFFPKRCEIYTLNASLIDRTFFPVLLKVTSKVVCFVTDTAAATTATPTTFAAVGGYLVPAIHIPMRFFSIRPAYFQNDGF